MDLTVRAYSLLMALVGVGRLVELGISRRHQRALRAAGAGVVAESVFPWMVLLHAAVLVAAPLEAARLQRRPRLAWVVVMGALLALANALRWWVIRTLAARWQVRVADSLPLGVVADGPFRWVRHPNYVAVALELLALPLLGGAWLTAALGTIAHGLVLRRRIAAEESVLLADPAYRALMGPKPRFIPGLL